MDAPLRDLTPEELERFDRDGVVLARGLFPAAWIERMARAVDRAVANPSLFGQVVSMPDRGFSGDLFLWKVDDDFRDWVFESPAARIAAQVLRSDTVRHFYDQLFVKPPGCHVPTPWHHDVTFWPVDVETRGICSMWIPFDPVDRASSGLEFVRGSQRWTERFRAITPDHDPYMKASDFAEPPDVDARRDELDVFSPDVEPGDCLIFDAHVVHGSSGNHTTERRRRAFSTRWMRPDVRFDDRPATMPLFWEHGLAPGQPLEGPLFPQVLPHTIPAEVERRARGPEPPDPAFVAAIVGRIQEHLRARAPAAGQGAAGQGAAGQGAAGQDSAG